MNMSDFIYMPNTHSWYVKKTATYIYQSYMQSILTIVLGAMHLMNYLIHLLVTVV
jgi:hypothetical protein